MSAPPPPRAPAEPPGPPAKSISFAKDAPAGSSGVCRSPKKKADAGAGSPEAMASCPDPTEYVRGDGIEVGKGLPAVKPTAMPPWDLDAVREFACAYACAPPGSAAHMLAWHVIEDSRPLRNHNAVFAVEHATTKPKWSVVVMYRHATNVWWNIHVSFHSPARPVRAFDHAPTDAEVASMLDENDWQFEHAKDASGFQILAGNVIDPLWKAVTGRAPSRSFPKGIEQP